MFFTVSDGGLDCQATGAESGYSDTFFATVLSVASLYRAARGLRGARSNAKS
ncbi:hypothetical protein KQH52_12685 [Mycetohabitans sp. B7]|uniref:hypothetical protein n=1 Tax=Mycetohabitans sp. B7 TaxID=2841844 RepID=UPI001F35A563|nr:hypothetical protein [Mycetohabitans sp. B7]MCG1040352.1 hypothetical protein [Mycetohabitans sp. B7]